MIPIVSELITAGQGACHQMRARISNVRLAPLLPDYKYDRIYFDFDGVKHVGLLKGRNRDFCIGHGEEAERSIALQVLLDGDARPTDEGLSSVAERMALSLESAGFGRHQGGKMCTPLEEYRALRLKL